LQQTQKKITEKRKDRAGRECSYSRRGGNERADRDAEDKCDEDAGGIGPGVLHRSVWRLTAEGAEGTEEYGSVLRNCSGGVLAAGR
jgi:hypothetical protein